MNVTKISLEKLENSRELTMQTPEIVEEILALHAGGLGQRRIAKELGIHRKTVQRYLHQKEWRPYQRERASKELDCVKGWLENAFHQHRGNAVVLRQELQHLHGIEVSIRTVQYAVSHLRREILAKAQATIRFETPPGRQMQIDFGSLSVDIGGVKQKVFFFAATLGYSRRQYVHAFLHEQQSSWFLGMEGAFQHFGGIPQEVLLDNARALVKHHNSVTREVLFNERLNAFSKYWGFRPRACAPYRARTKGKDENTVKYIKYNAIAGRSFSTFETLQGHLEWWMREVSDVRYHGTTGEQPIERFKEELAHLRPLEGRPPFLQIQELRRIVHTDACVEVETNFYSVPWHLIKQTVTVQVIDGELRILHGEEEVARHQVRPGTRERSICSTHLQGILGAQLKEEKKVISELLRPLSEYAALVEGGF